MKTGMKSIWPLMVFILSSALIMAISCGDKGSNVEDPANHRPNINSAASVMALIDEPFSSLDPVNTQMVKDLLDEERHKGRAIIMCTHQMHQVEELCDRIVLIDRGRAMLYGTLQEVRNRYATQDILVNSSARFPAHISGVDRIEDVNTHKKLVLKPGIKAQSVLKELVQKEVPLEHFEIALPSLDEIFIQVVQNGEAG